MFTISRWHRSPALWLGLVAVVGAMSRPAPARAQLPNDPVEQLSKALKSPSTSATRRREIEPIVRSLTTISELHRALALQDWLDKDEEPIRDEARVDREFRSSIANRYITMMRATLQRGNPLAQITAANLLADLDSSLRAVSARDPNGLNRVFGPDLVPLTKSNDPKLQEAAARAVGAINADPKISVPALAGLLDSPVPEVRRAAEASLSNMLHRQTQLVTRKANPIAGVLGSRSDLIAAAVAAAPLASKGLASNDVEVRRLAAEMLFNAANALSELVDLVPVLERGLENLSAPPGQPEDALRDEPNARRVAQRESDQLEPLVKALAAQAPALTHALTDSDPRVRLLARKALEEYGYARSRQERHASSSTVAPEPGTDNAKGNQPRPSVPPGSRLANTLNETLRSLVAGLNDPDVAVRLATVDALEMFTDAAKPAAPYLVRALRDPNRFVRWAAARTLGKMAPVETATVVPALAERLRDTDLAVRVVAAGALERFGPQAASALPALSEASGRGDADIRKAAMHAIAATGSEGRVAVPAVSAQLSNDNPRIRQTAAEVLGRLGPLARSAEPALRKAMSDSDGDVRKAVSGALLNVLGTPSAER